ncbi:MAG: TrkA family potassium uptake protein [Lachnospiraceae bacterium]|nr:TrkA family potassium uptake protein [Lachnospiraceae bacterium]
MMTEGYAILGLGRFGKTVALTLAEAGFQVMAVDIRDEKIQEVASEVTYAVRGDVTEPEMVRSLGLGNMDGVVIAIAHNLEASVMATLLAKESGASYILAKGDNEIHKTILEKMGADKVVIPEQEMGVSAARNMVLGRFMDLIELSDDVSLIEMTMPLSWVGKNLIDLDLREQYGVNVVAIKSGSITDVTPSPSKPMQEDQIIILSGRNEDLQRLSKIK